VTDGSVHLESLPKHIRVISNDLRSLGKAEILKFQFRIPNLMHTNTFTSLSQIADSSQSIWCSILCCIAFYDSPWSVMSVDLNSNIRRIACIPTEYSNSKIKSS